MNIKYKHTAEAYRFAYKHYGVAGAIAYHLNHPHTWKITDHDTIDWLIGDLGHAIDELRNKAKSN